MEVLTMTKKEMTKLLLIATLVIVATTSVIGGICVWVIGKIVIDHTASDRN